MKGRLVYPWDKTSKSKKYFYEKQEILLVIWNVNGYLVKGKETPKETGKDLRENKRV